MLIKLFNDNALHGHLPHDDDDSVSCRWQQMVMHGSSWWGKVLAICNMLYSTTVWVHLPSHDFDWNNSINVSNLQHVISTVMWIHLSLMTMMMIIQFHVDGSKWSYMGHHGGGVWNLQYVIFYSSVSSPPPTMMTETTV